MTEQLEWVTVDLTILVDVIVRGLPAPQGSKRAIVHRTTGKAVTMESSKRVKPWRDAVRSTVADAWHGGRYDGPVIVEIIFFFPRPRSHYGTGKFADRLKLSAPPYPAGPPDADKLARSTLDGITSAGLWTDDARVVDLIARKRYCSADALEHPGARIIVRRP